MKKTLLEIQHIDTKILCPADDQLQNWVDVALQEYQSAAEIVIRIVDEQESAALNEQYRKKTGPTNILSFPFDVPEGFELDLLGDLVVCSAIVELEAKQQNKLLFDHWAHIIIHGVLHLLGYDHVHEFDAQQMETKEINFLQQLSIANPYQQEINS